MPIVRSSAPAVVAFAVEMGAAASLGAAAWLGRSMVSPAAGVAVRRPSFVFGDFQRFVAVGPWSFSW